MHPHARTGEHDGPVPVEQTPGRRRGAYRLNIAHDHIKGAETLPSPIAVDGESDLAIVQSNAPNSRILAGRTTKNLRPARSPDPIRNI